MEHILDLKIKQLLIEAFKEGKSGICEVATIEQENSTITGLSLLILASNEFWHISLAKDLYGEPLKVSIPASPIPLSVPKLLLGKFHPIVIFSSNQSNIW